MAKEKFERNKPHVNVQTFRKMGISPSGARELAMGLPVTLLTDRRRIAAIVSTAGET